MLLSNFPYFSVSSPSFLAAMLMVLVNHYLAFAFFGQNFYPFSEVCRLLSLRCKFLLTNDIIKVLGVTLFFIRS